MYRWTGASIIELEKVGQGSGVVQKGWQGHRDRAGPHAGWTWVGVGTGARLNGIEWELWVDGSWPICQTSNAHPTLVPVLRALILPLAIGSACAILIHSSPCSRRAGTHDSAAFWRCLVWKHHTLVLSCEMMACVILIRVKVRWRLAHSVSEYGFLVSSAKYNFGMKNFDSCLEQKWPLEIWSQNPICPFDIFC